MIPTTQAACEDHPRQLVPVTQLKVAASVYLLTLAIQISYSASRNENEVFQSTSQDENKVFRSASPNEERVSPSVSRNENRDFRVIVASHVPDHHSPPPAIRATCNLAASIII